MNPEAPMCGKRRGFRRWFWIALASLPVASFILGNLWLASPGGRNWIAAKLQQRTGLETRIGGVSITPWNGIRFHQVELLQPPELRPSCPEPLARFEAIHLSPVWREWFKGRRALQSVKLDTPRLAIPVELLASLARSQAPAPTQPPAPEAVPVEPPSKPPVAEPPPPLPEQPPKKPDTPEPAPPPAPALPPTSWLHLENASILLFSASSGTEHLQLSDIDGSIPISGAAAQSTLKINSVEASGNTVVDQLEAQLNWKAPVLSLTPLTTEALGLQVVLGAQLAMHSGLPIQIEARIPPQPLPATDLPAGANASADGITANSRFRGLLLAPPTWQGNLVAQCASPSGRVAGKDAAFDSGSAVVVLRGGILSCPDARLIGDDLSLLGNATLLTDGRAAAALRIVAPPETLGLIVKQAFPGLPETPPLTPLSSPQRSAFDLEAFGNIGNLSIRLGKGGPVQKLNP